MTIVEQVETRTIPVKTKVLVLLLATLIGGGAGALAWRNLFSKSQAIAVVSIGKLDQLTGWIEEPQAVMERMQSSGFATAVAARAHIPEIATLLPASQYGGAGALTARSLRDVNLIEIRVSTASPDVAKAAVAASVDEVVAEHAVRIAPLIGGFQSSLKSMEDLAADTISSSEALTKRLSETTPDGSNSQEIATLTAARASAETGVGALVKSIGELKMLSASIRPTRAVTAPSVSTPQASSFYRTIATGAIAGFLLGLLALQMLPGFFASSRSSTRDLPPLA